MRCGNWTKIAGYVKYKFSGGDLNVFALVFRESGKGRSDFITLIESLRRNRNTKHTKLIEPVGVRVK